MCEKELTKFINKYIYPSDDFITAKELIRICKLFTYSKKITFNNVCFRNAVKHNNIKKDRKYINNKLVTVYFCRINKEAIRRFENHINNKVQFLITNAEKIENYYKINRKILKQVKDLIMLDYLYKKRIRINGKQITVYKLSL